MDETNKTTKIVPVHSHGGHRASERLLSTIFFKKGTNNKKG